MKRVIVVLLLALWVVAPSYAQRTITEKVDPQNPSIKIYTIETTNIIHKRQSYHDAKLEEIAYIKRQILDRAGVYIKNEYEVENHVVTKEQSRAVVAAVMQTKVNKEKFEIRNDQQVLILNLEIRVNTDRNLVERVLVSIT